ncbi:hypothetical protein [Actinomadura logoneensis]|uniref:hypothetical protein n=1 Tax=Actinomadura logoneensis TaxID=2293572 RepID=UPI001F398AF6|nr:hypothetical protein [Actinomadura logoneensis]
MADAWLPEAVRLPARLDGGALRGGAPRAVWLTSGSDPRSVSARSLAADLAKIGRPAHVVWNPLTGEVVQQLPIVRAGLALAEDGPGPGPGREGRICAQIMVVGQAREPFTTGPLTGLDPIVRWLDGWGVARRWPAGPPLATPQSYESPRDRRDWARGGHFGASQVPDAVRPDPGGIDVRRITGPDTPPAGLSRTRPTQADAGPLVAGAGTRTPLLTRSPVPAPASPTRTPLLTRSPVPAPASPTPPATTPAPPVPAAPTVPAAPQPVPASAR